MAKGDAATAASARGGLDRMSNNIVIWPDKLHMSGRNVESQGRIH